jgi:hypothetical protein
MREYTSESLRRIVEEMVRIEREHEKATVLFDTEHNRINITYPLPKDFYEISSIKISGTPLTDK